MLARSVTFLPQFLGALLKARSPPLRDQPYSGQSENVGTHLVHEHKTLGVDLSGY